MTPFSIPIVVVCGPTAVGKTTVAIELAQRFNGEIVGADSMQLYTDMRIGTAMPTPAELAAVPHHLVAWVSPDTPVDAAGYARAADALIARIHARGCRPFVAGGTGLYIKALLHGLFEAPAVDPAVRRRWQQCVADRGPAAVHAELARRDPASADRIHPNDTFRIVRALETLESTGRSMTDWHRTHQFEGDRYPFLKIGLDMDRERLYDRIDRRVDAMLAGGFADEVRQLLAMGYSPELKAMQSIGYRHMVRRLHGEIDEPTMRDTLKRDTRRYAKRQLTWFRADPEIHWIPVESIEVMVRLIEAFFRAHC